MFGGAFYGKLYVVAAIFYDGVNISGDMFVWCVGDFFGTLCGHIDTRHLSGNGYVRLIRRGGTPGYSGGICPVVRILQQRHSEQKYKEQLALLFKGEGMKKI